MDNKDKMMEKLIPKLEELVQKSDGALKGFDIFDEFKPGYVDVGSRPRRMRKLNKYTPEDKAIMIGGFHVGHMLSNIPWLNTNTWKGRGLSIGDLPK